MTDVSFVVFEDAVEAGPGTLYPDVDRQQDPVPSLSLLETIDLEGGDAFY